MYVQKKIYLNQKQHGDVYKYAVDLVSVSNQNSCKDLGHNRTGSDFHPWTLVCSWERTLGRVR